MNGQEYCDAVNGYQTALNAMKANPALAKCKQIMGMVALAKLHHHRLILTHNEDINETSIENPSTTSFTKDEASEFADLFLQAFGAYLSPRFWRIFVAKITPLVTGPDIPELPKVVVSRRVERIKPRIAKGGKLFSFDLPDLWNQSYTWDPKNLVEDETPMRAIRDVTTYHTFGYHGLFKPSIAEVLSQVPKDILDEAQAFAIVASPETADDLNREKRALNLGFHVATTRFFTTEVG